MNHTEEIWHQSCAKPARVTVGWVPHRQMIPGVEGYGSEPTVIEPRKRMDLVETVGDRQQLSDLVLRPNSRIGSNRPEGALGHHRAYVVIPVYPRYLLDYILGD